MPIVDRYRYVATLYGVTGDSLGTVALTPDFGPAVAWAEWEAMRSDALSPQLRPPAGTVEPRWDATRGAPYIDGVRVSVTGVTPAAIPCEIPRGFFTRIVERETPRLVANGTLVAGTTFLYDVCAYPAAAVGRTDHDHDELATPLTVTPGRLDSRATAARRCARAAWVDTDMPVFVAQQVLDEVTALARAADDVETGGILVGRLVRDPDTGLFCEITAQIPAQHTQADSSRLTFTAETWAAARSAIALRGGEECATGWWHSHPDFCRNCPPASRDRCPLRRPFFSRDDVDLHHTVFGAGMHIALLVSQLGDAVSCDVFGWRHGVVAARGYYALGDAESTRAASDEGLAARVDGAARTGPASVGECR